jgi:arylsulfatase A-like enzyme
MKRTIQSILLLIAISVSGHAAEAARPNILWLISEDTGPEALSRNGTPQAATPNLDKLADQGVYFSHTYLGNVCSVSRSSFMTGMHAASIGAQNHRSHRTGKDPLPAGVRVLTDWLRDAGYFTANVVKLPDALGFIGTGKTDWNFTYEGKPFDSADWDDLKPHQPFYAQINFHETHRKFNAPAKADPAKVVLPPYYPDDPIVRKDWAAYLDSEIELDGKVGLVLAQLEKDGLADNTIIVYFGDNGACMARGKQFCYEEGFIVPLIIRWPKKFLTPKNFKPGTVEPRFIDGIDLAPTMLNIAGASKPPKMQGRNFLGDHAEVPREYVFGTRDRCDETVMRIRSVRDVRYRYIHNFTPGTPFLAPNDYKEMYYPVWNLLKQLHAEGKLTPTQEFLCQPRMPDEELYDLQTDPDEIHNLAASTNATHQAVLKKLRGVLDQWIVDVDDKGRVFETAAALAAQGAPKKNVKKTKTNK